MERIELKNALGNIYVTITHEKDLDAVKDVWTGSFGSQENFKKGLETIVQVLERTKSKKWLADLREMKGSFDPSGEWLANTIMPRCIELGLQYEAIVLPRDIFAKLSTRETIRRIQNLEIRQFGHYEEAETWLRAAVLALGAN